MAERLSWAEALSQIGVTKNTIYLWEKNNKIPKAKRDRNKARIITSEWVQECINFRDRVVDPNEETVNENSAG